MYLSIDDPKFKLISKFSILVFTELEKGRRLKIEGTNLLKKAILYNAKKKDLIKN